MDPYIYFLLTPYGIYGLQIVSPVSKTPIFVIEYLYMLLILLTPKLIKTVRLTSGGQMPHLSVTDKMVLSHLLLW